mmetsp:Transcript_65530/g.191798  ORF Transcript_65530/g.191798 Transcript_65530/m.191798 type:complete len:424 (+) Transcript_65530:143-1414(+)
MRAGSLRGVIFLGRLLSLLQLGLLLLHLSGGSLRLDPLARVTLVPLSLGVVRLPERVQRLALENGLPRIVAELLERHQQGDDADAKGHPDRDAVEGVGELLSVHEQLVPGPHEHSHREAEDEGLRRLVGALEVRRHELGQELRGHALEREGRAREGGPDHVDQGAVAGGQRRAADAVAEQQDLARNPDALHVAVAVDEPGHCGRGEPRRGAGDHAVGRHRECVELEAVVEGHEDRPPAGGDDVAQEADRHQRAELMRGKYAEVVPRAASLMPAVLEEPAEGGLPAELWWKRLREQEADHEGIKCHDHGAHDSQEPQAAVYPPRPIPAPVSRRQAVLHSALILVHGVLVWEPVAILAELQEAHSHAGGHPERNLTDEEQSRFDSRHSAARVLPLVCAHDVPEHSIADGTSHIRNERQDLCEDVH